MGMHFAYFGLELGMVFEGTREPYERFQMNKNEKEIWEFKMDLKSFLFALYSGNDDIISAKCTYQRGITQGTYASMGWDLSTWFDNLKPGMEGLDCTFVAGSPGEHPQDF